jgi:hypothetical protein
MAVMGAVFTVQAGAIILCHQDSIYLEEVGTTADTTAAEMAAEAEEEIVAAVAEGVVRLSEVRRTLPTTRFTAC